MLNCLRFGLFLGILCFATLGGASILPTPARMEPKEGSFELNSQSVINATTEFESEAKFLQDGILQQRGLRLSIEGRHQKENSLILCRADSENSLGSEGYLLEIFKRGVRISANGPRGVFYGVQSLLQLISAGRGPVLLECVKIGDSPRYGWRSLMLDSGRQYQSISTIKGFIDRMALLKLNVFHWHLTENDGWRIAIKKYPKLTEVGAFLADGAEQEGFYTQEEIREIVAYAADRHITVVPEIDMPGHSEAALMAYPELTCSGKAPSRAGKGFSPYLYCGGRDSTLKFLCDVLDEVCELFPSEYIHIGGDEAPKSEWKKCSDCQARITARGLKNEHELQIYLSNRLAKHLATKGRKAICWGDVVTSPGQELESNIVIDWWNYRRNKDKALREGIKRGLPVIANCNYYTYLNFPQKDPWKGYNKKRIFDLQTCYEQNPCDLQNPTAEEAAALIGMGASLWTDYGLREKMLDKRLFPRLYALAEQMWHRGKRLPYEEFKMEIESQLPLLRKKGFGMDGFKEMGLSSN